MKQQVFKRLVNYLIIIVLIVSSSIARADSEKRKSVNKSYKVSSSTIVHLNNSFGKMHVETWDKNEVKVDIEVIVRASSDDRAQSLLDKISIDIDDGNPSGRLSFSTSISNNKSGRNTSFEINYDVSMPKTNNVDLKNSFGDLYLGDLSGDAEIDVQYGNMKTGRLTGDSEIKLSFGSGFSEIDALNEGEIKISFNITRLMLNARAALLCLEKEQSFCFLILDS